MGSFPTHHSFLSIGIPYAFRNRKRLGLNRRHIPGLRANRRGYGGGHCPHRTRPRGTRKVRVRRKNEGKGWTLVLRREGTLLEGRRGDRPSQHTQGRSGASGRVFDPRLFDRDGAKTRLVNCHRLTCALRCFRRQSVAREESLVARCRSKALRRGFLLPRSVVGDIHKYRDGTNRTRNPCRTFRTGFGGRLPNG